MTWFIVLRTYSSYEGSWTSHLGITDDEAIAKVVVEEWELRKLRAAEVYKEAREWYASWEQKNPRPKLAVPKPLRLPHEGIPKKKMTPLQLADREAAKEAHQLATLNAGTPFREWMERQSREYHEFMSKFTAQELQDTNNGMGYIEDDFSYEPIEVL